MTTRPLPSLPRFSAEQLRRSWRAKPSHVSSAVRDDQGEGRAVVASVTTATRSGVTPPAEPRFTCKSPDDRIYEPYGEHLVRDGRPIYGQTFWRPLIIMLGAAAVSLAGPALLSWKAEIDWGYVAAAAAVYGVVAIATAFALDWAYDRGFWQTIRGLKPADLPNSGE